MNRPTRDKEQQSLACGSDWLKLRFRFRARAGTRVANPNNDASMTLAAPTKSLRRIQSRGFTLIELLLVISIVGMIMAVSVPVSYNMYQNYKVSLRVEEVLIYVSKMRRESFLYGEEVLLSSKDGHILQRDGTIGFADVFVQIDDPIKFYKNGTTSGGVLKLHAGNSSYLLKITPPFGELLLERET